MDKLNKLLSLSFCLKPSSKNKIKLPNKTHPITIFFSPNLSLHD